MPGSLLLRMFDTSSAGITLSGTAIRQKTKVLRSDSQNSLSCAPTT